MRGRFTQPGPQVRPESAVEVAHAVRLDAAVQTELAVAPVCAIVAGVRSPSQPSRVGVGAPGQADV